MHLDLLSIAQSVVDSGIESASAACFTFPCLMASGKLPAALWVAVEGNVEPPSEEKEEGIGEKPPANNDGRRAAGSASLRVVITCAQNSGSVQT